MEPMYYIGLDLHKRKISYCVKDSSGKIYAEGSLPATRMDLDLWMKTLPHPWSGWPWQLLSAEYPCEYGHPKIARIILPLNGFAMLKNFCKQVAQASACVFLFSPPTLSSRTRALCG